jgi:hypothetical protein
MGNTIVFNWRKTGTSSKPTALHNLVLSISNYFTSIDRRIYWFIIYFSITILIACSYYLYLHHRYIIDETYDIHGPGELTLAEQFTIRLYAPATIAALSKLLLHYSICPIVHEIEVLWHSNNVDAPLIESFKYSTAHSKVSYIYFDSTETVFETYYRPKDRHTEATLLVDADTFLSCADLNFMYSVWRSSKFAAVGAFPRAVR